VGFGREFGTLAVASGLKLVMLKFVSTLLSVFWDLQLHLLVIVPFVKLQVLPKTLTTTYMLALENVVNQSQI